MGEVYQLSRWPRPGLGEKVGDRRMGKVMRPDLLRGESFGVEQCRRRLANVSTLGVRTGDIDK